MILKEKLPRGCCKLDHLTTVLKNYEDIDEQMEILEATVKLGQYCFMIHPDAYFSLYMAVANCC